MYLFVILIQIIGIICFNTSYATSLNSDFLELNAYFDSIDFKKYEVTLPLCVFFWTFSLQHDDEKRLLTILIAFSFGLLTLLALHYQQYYAGFVYFILELMVLVVSVFLLWLMSFVCAVIVRGVWNLICSLYSTEQDADVEKMLTDDLLPESQNV